MAGMIIIVLIWLNIVDNKQQKLITNSITNIKRKSSESSYRKTS